MFSGGFSLVHWLVVGIILLLLFGKGRFSAMMGDVAKGIKSFKKGMTEEEEEEARQAAEPRRIDARPVEPTVVRSAEADPTPAERAPTAAGDRREP
ncbi:twin-arginine translocase TatA/TatE family subunit [Allosphingosinicella sp.]|jgi:sec-independent protein translocase protein TatA|uniref:twin-arginine translocase TatA/TatE family subunit n=1 Tax=Allosphingosinicella sp. TaxID=2823234 RepID=UPI002F1CFA4B